MSTVSITAEERRALKSIGTTIKNGGCVTFWRDGYLHVVVSVRLSDLTMVVRPLNGPSFRVPFCGTRGLTVRGKSSYYRARVIHDGFICEVAFGRHCADIPYA